MLNVYLASFGGDESVLGIMNVLNITELFV